MAETKRTSAGQKKTVKAKPKISLILPVYNEEGNLRIQYAKIADALSRIKYSYEIIFVDDGSTDSSTDILKEIAAKDKQVKLILFRRNFGQTAAMSAGIEYSSGEIILFMDSDLQNDPEDIGRLVAKINEGYDVVSGWRVNRKDSLFIRKIPSKAANWLISKISGIKLHDLGCSLKAYRGDILRQISLYGEMHRFIPIHVSWIGASITEIPVNHNPRIYGQSKYGLKRVFKVILDLITVKFLGSYSTKPIYLFGGFGLIQIFFGIACGAATIVMKYTLGRNMTGNPLLSLTIILLIIGVLFIQMGILAELMIRIYHEAKHTRPYHIDKTINF
ncbi:MAG: glycosyltransferase family 2 protein [Spirochaetia bacterium]|jgi:glycosyltransferase involved in cell wall biosynthesis|nr:glycosyltransferase family 2 protein [Spirochaetia bacterium]